MKRKWWHDKVAYQIYPKSFMDTNGDGIGDLRGIISKLDYLKELGVDIIWLSPIYKSPFVDQGYDISDYYGIAEEFGTMEEFDELLAETKKRGMYLIMDLVINHCSDQHEWFQKALKDPTGEYGDYFYFRKGKNGNPPSNYRSYFGGSCWEPVAGTDLYYLHFFAKEQPDLNWENPVLRNKLYDMINWWLDKGLAGFRIDAIINIKKDLNFPSYEPDGADGLSGIWNMIENVDGVNELLEDLKHNTFEKYDAFTVGEVFNIHEDDLARFIGENGHFSTMFDFYETCYGKSEKGAYDSERYLTPEEYKHCIFRTQKRVGDLGMVSNIIENHDEPRGVSHYIQPEDLCLASKKLLGGVNFCLKGLPFLYQGQEIGMENTVFSSVEDVDDIGTLDEYKVGLDAGLSPKEALEAAGHFSRDNGRTPMQWSAGEQAGFTTGKPWLAVNPNYTRINVESQENDPDSVLNFYRKLTALRKDSRYQEALVYGTFVPYLEEETNLIGYLRKTEAQTLLVLANFQKDGRMVKFPGEMAKVVLNNLEDAEVKDGSIAMKPYQFVVLEVK